MIENLHSQLATKTEQLKKFLSVDQLKSLSYEKMKEWSPDSIIKGLKFRYMLGLYFVNL